MAKSLSRRLLLIGMLLFTHVIQAHSMYREKQDGVRWTFGMNLSRPDWQRYTRVFNELNEINPKMTQPAALRKTWSGLTFGVWISNGPWIGKVDLGGINNRFVIRDSLDEAYTYQIKNRIIDFSGGINFVNTSEFRLAAMGGFNFNFLQLRGSDKPIAQTALAPVIMTIINPFSAIANLFGAGTAWKSYSIRAWTGGHLSLMMTLGKKSEFGIEYSMHFAWHTVNLSKARNRVIPQDQQIYDDSQLRIRPSYNNLRVFVTFGRDS